MFFRKNDVKGVAHEEVALIRELAYNPLVPGVHQKVTHTQTNLQLWGVSLFKYVWPFSEHQALKG